VTFHPDDVGGLRAAACATHFVHRDRPGDTRPDNHERLPSVTPERDATGPASTDVLALILHDQQNGRPAPWMKALTPEQLDD